MRKFKLLLQFISVIFLLLTQTSALNKMKLKEALSYTVTKVIPSNQKLYTEGLIFNSDATLLYQSSGLYGQSKLVKMEWPSQTVLLTSYLNSKYFAEGIAYCGSYLYMLTWKERTIIKYTYPEMNLVGTLAMPSQMQEGWGLATYSDTQMVASDGTHNLYFLDCNNDLAVTKILPVINGNYYVSSINELEFAKGLVWANVYYSNVIYAIDPTTGYVTKSYDMTALVNYEMSRGTLTYTGFESGYVLNGIAYNKVKDNFLVTGKDWGYYYEVNFN